MKLYSKIIIVLLLIIIPVLLILNGVISKKVSPVQSNSPAPTVTSAPDEGIPNVKKADKIEVLNFHRTQRCWSCLTLGKLSEKTVSEKFADDVASGKVIFKAVNIELPENKEIVNLYQAGGSSLYINAIKDGKNNIVQNMKVWQLLSDEPAFTNYLETQLRSLL